AYGDTPTDESAERRRQRVDRYLSRQPHERMPLPDRWTKHVPNYQIHGIIEGHDGPSDVRHWEHLPDDVVSLKQPIHTHQGFVCPDAVKAKLHGESADPDHYDSWYEEPGGHEPKFVRHQGQHFLLDGHHRFAHARLMGHGSMWGKVFDTANPDHKQMNCYGCHVNDIEDNDRYDHDSGDCPDCQHHGWYV
ncbi:MAG: hypothetical protein ACREP9_02765, partial [Candidatus Dormibacteraceae bacterium]